MKKQKVLPRYWSREDFDPFKDEFATNRVRNTMYSPVLDWIRNTSTEGCNYTAQKLRNISGNTDSTTLSTKGISNTAVSLSNKTLQETQEGLAVTLDPVDPRTTLQRMKSQLSSLPSLRLVYKQRQIQELCNVPEEVLPQPPEDELNKQGLRDNPKW